MNQYKETIIKLLRVLHPDLRIYLFGSRARGTNAPEADIDLALDRGRKLTISELSIIKNIIEALDIPYMVDVVDVVDVYRIPLGLKRSNCARGN